MMAELTPCPVCTLYLHKGMSLAEHLDTHPKEQVIRALVSLTSISPTTAQSLVSISTLSATSSTGTITLSKSSSSLPPPPLITPPVLQSSSSVTTVNAQLSSSTSLVSSLAGGATLTTVSSVSDTTFSKTNNSTKNGERQQQQQNLTVASRQNELFYQITSDGQTNPPVINYSSNNNTNQHLNSHQQTHLQEFLNYQNKTTKKLPPPPTYGTAISQLRSQNNQSNYGRLQQSMTLNYQSSNPINITYGSNSNNSHNNIRYNQETLDYSLPKPSQQQQPAHTNTTLLSPRHLKSQYSITTTTTPTQTKVHQQQSTSSTNFASPSSSPGNNSNQQFTIKKAHRTPSPTISLIPQNLSSPRQAQSPSVLRYAESPISVQYIERDNGEFLVKESPRHIVQCFEKDDGQFSVIEKVIRSPPALVQIDEFDDEYNETYVRHHINNKLKTDEHLKVENDESSKNKNECKTKNEPCTSNALVNQIKKTINNIKMDDIVADNNNEDDDDDDIIIIKEETPPKKNNPNGIKVLSDVKLDPNESLDIMENINKIGSRNCSDHFFQSIVQSIKKEEDLKISNNNNKILTSSSAPTTIDLDCNLNKSNSTINDETPTCSNISTSSNNSIGTTSVIRLAGQKEDLKKLSSNITPTCTVDLTIKPSTSNSCRNDNMKPYKKHPKKLVVKFKNPIIPKITEINHNLNNDNNTDNIAEIINLDEPSELIVTDSTNKDNNLLKNKIDEKLNKKSSIQNNNEDDEKINIILDINESVFSVTEITENDNKSDFKMDIENYKITDPNNSEKNESPTNKLDFIKNNNESMETETDLNNCNNNKNNNLIENLNETVDVIIELPESDCKDSELLEKSNDKSDSIGESINSFLINCSASTSLSSKSSLDDLCSKPSTSNSFLSQTEIQQQNSQQPGATNYLDYPFSYLYTAGPAGVQINNSMCSNAIINPTVELQQNTNNQISANNLSLNYNQNSETASDLFQHHHYNNNDATIFSNDIEDEKSSYLDLDACSSNKAITSCSTTSNSSNAISSILSNNDHIPLVEALNIRTDEKMPAKGEISEQESNGDIENSWSQPLYTELAYKFPNQYDHFVSRESWSLSHDDFFIPHDLSTSGRTKFIPEKLQHQQQPSSTIAEVSSTIRSSSIKKKKKSNKKKPTTTASTTATASIAPELLNQRATSVPIKRKIFKCEHCGSIFLRLKERNNHLIDQHQYKRVNRRLVRELPSSTITSASIINQNQILTEPKLEPIDSSITTNLLDDGSNLIKIENPDDLLDMQSMPTAIDNTDSNEDKKPILSVVSAKIEQSNFPRTKYDSIRGNIYRMLMNFNLSVLQQKGGIDIEEKKLFESKSFCCYTCKRDFISVKLYDEHLAEHAAECFTCNKKFSRWTYFSIHLKRHLGWKDFGCTHCDKKFVIRSALIEHIRTHTGIAPLKCNLCSKSFKRYSNLTQHKKNFHSKKPIRTKEYVCYCGEVLPSKARYLWHKEIHDSKPKCCPWCRDRFVHANSLRRHIRLMHSDKFSYSEPVVCTICNQVYAKSSLKSHMTTHSMDTQHECPICNKSFSTKWNLKIHSWVHANRTAKPFKCEFCTKAFVREIDYKNHMNAHKQIRPYTCEYCGCKFIRKYNYMRHRREHHGQKKFSCDLCSKLFHRHYYLIEHRRIHTGERPFLCTICGKSSTTKTNHNKHLKIHHSRDPFTSES